jgi:integral membrane protein (TIGR00529 family)
MPGEFLLDGIPATVRVLAAFAAVLLAMRKRLSLGSSFLLGSVLLAVLFDAGFRPAAESVVRSVTDPKTLSLAVIVSLILVLSSSMERMGAMKRLLDKFTGLVSNPRVNLVVFPALIGLLPMPGGAVFSAPMVKQLSGNNGLTADQLSYVNYWFRHIWEYWWPLYPGVLLSTTLAGVNLWSFVALMCPLTAVALLAGYLPIRNLESPARPEGRVSFASAAAFAGELSPIAMVIFLGLGAGWLFSRFVPRWPIAMETGLILALVLSILSTWRRCGAGREEIFRLLTDRHILSMAYMVFSILIFKGMLEDTRAVSAITGELLALGAPLALAVVLLPFFVGGIVGITIAFVGSTFPILIPLVHSYGEGSFLMAYLMLALTSGFIGVLLSPLHLCLLLSNRYFGASMKAVYVHLRFPVLILALSVALYFSFVRWGVPAVFPLSG